MRFPHPIRLPDAWPGSVKSGVLYVICLARYALGCTRSWAVNSVNERVRLKAENQRLWEEVGLLREEIRIKDARMARIAPGRRPYYPPTERMTILELRAARGWSMAQTARAFLVTSATVASWMKRVDEDGPDALVQIREPVNKFPDFIAYIVRRLKTLCPTMGKRKIAETLARAGLHLGATTVGRMLKEKPRTIPPTAEVTSYGRRRVVTADYADHVWHIDLTVMPTMSGLWCSWLPFSLPQRWPFCHWVAVDHFSRRVMGCIAFKDQPTSQAVRSFLERTIAKAKKTPKYIVCDRGRQFDCQAFRDWCRRQGIKPPRYGAVGKHGSIAVVERFILTLKRLLSCLLLVRYRRQSFQRELDAIVEWYNIHRAHTWLGGKAPDEVYFGKYPANRKPRFEPRERWPHGSPCAKPWALVRGRPGAKVMLEVSFHHGRKHLPIVTLKRAA